MTRFWRFFALLSAAGLSGCATSGVEEQPLPMVEAPAPRITGVLGEPNRTMLFRLRTFDEANIERGGVPCDIKSQGFEARIVTPGYTDLPLFGDLTAPMTITCRHERFGSATYRETPERHRRLDEHSTAEGLGILSVIEPLSLVAEAADLAEGLSADPLRYKSYRRLRLERGANLAGTVVAGAARDGTGSATGAPPQAAALAVPQKPKIPTTPLASFKECGACPEMVVLPAGNFLMGSPDNEPGRERAEGPQQRISIASFAMARFEATKGQWRQCIAEGYCVWPEETPHRLADEYPMNQTTRQTILGDGRQRGFIAWLNSKVEGEPYFLPSEAQWEYAARGGATTRYPFGDDDAQLGDYAWFTGLLTGNSNEETHPVGGKKPNQFGLHDMLGNITEVVRDCWVDTLAGVPLDGSPRLSGDCEASVWRGGSGLLDKDFARITFRRPYRDSDLFGYVNSVLGFRVARSLDDALAAEQVQEGAAGIAEASVEGAVPVRPAKR